MRESSSGSWPQRRLGVFKFHLKLQHMDNNSGSLGVIFLGCVSVCAFGVLFGARRRSEKCCFAFFSQTSENGYGFGGVVR